MTPITRSVHCKFNCITVVCTRTRQSNYNTGETGDIFNVSWTKFKLSQIRFVQWSDIILKSWFVISKNERTCLRSFHKSFCFLSLNFSLKNTSLGIFLSFTTIIWVHVWTDVASLNLLVLFCFLIICQTNTWCWRCPSLSVLSKLVLFYFSSLYVVL